MPEKINAEIMYIGFEFNDHEFINSEQLRDFLSQHPYLHISEIENDDETGEEVFRRLDLPVADNEGPVVIVDERLEGSEDDYLLICHEDDAYIDNPSAEFVAILKMMQKVKAEDEEEMFIDQSAFGSENPSPSHWSWEFDFTTGKYVTPES